MSKRANCLFFEYHMLASGNGPNSKNLSLYISAISLSKLRDIKKPNINPTNIIKLIS